MCSNIFLVNTEIQAKVLIILHAYICLNQIKN